MKTLLQKIHVEEYDSFACRTYRTPHFETSWHRHSECELILIQEGRGTAFIGNYVGDYVEGDIFLLNSNIPHWFRKSKSEDTGSATVIHFRKDFWGTNFLDLPEMGKIADLLQHNNSSIQLLGNLPEQIGPLIKTMEHTHGFDRFQLLLTCLQKIGISTEQVVVTKAFDRLVSGEENTIIEAVMDYSFKNFSNPISLNEVAAISNMSVPTFCRFFKKNIKMRYFDFIKEIRIGYACKLLRETEKSILSICYSCGYNNWSHFSRQFKFVKKVTPSHYRAQYSQNSFLYSVS